MILYVMTANMKNGKDIDTVIRNMRGISTYQFPVRDHVVK